MASSSATSPPLDDNRLLRATFDRVDWNFSDVSTPQDAVHALHWFPGNFIPQIPAYLIQALSGRGAIVLDPFSGSGTTAVEALRLGRHAWQSDAAQASVQVSRGKVSFVARPEMADILRPLMDSLVWDSLYRTDATGKLGEGQDPQLSKWFARETLAQLRYLWKAIEGFEGDARNALELLFADLLFACASTSGSLTRHGLRRRHHWGWIADNVVPKVPAQHNAIALFRKRLAHALDVIRVERGVPFAGETWLADARALPFPDESVDLVVTSPPYVGMIDYTLANRLTYLWMGWRLEDDRAAEIGARRQRNTRNAACAYLSAMEGVLKQLHRVMRPRAYCAIVVGASRRFPDVPAALFHRFAGYFELVWGPHARVPSRRRVSERGGTEPMEWICVYQKSP